MAKKDTYAELNALVTEKEATKNAALSKLFAAKAEAEARLAAALPKKETDLENFDVEAFLKTDAELARLPHYIEDIDAKIHEILNKPLGQPFDVFMSKVAALSGEDNENFEKKFSELAADLYKLCVESRAYQDSLHNLETRWLCDPMANYTHETYLIAVAGRFFHDLYNRNFHISDDFEPFI